MKEIISDEFNAHISAANLLHSLTDIVAKSAQLCISSLNNGGKILIFGNGGSAADAQHIAAEMVGRYKIDRNGLPAIALTTDSSILTSISNDFGYTQVFSRQVKALANKGDVLIGISTSGSSANVISALKLASKMNCIAIGFSGKDGGEFITLCDVNLLVDSNDTPRIQEMHILIGHTLCHVIEQELESSS